MRERLKLIKNDFVGSAETGSKKQETKVKTFARDFSLDLGKVTRLTRSQGKVL